jgi:hypothetical protein
LKPAKRGKARKPRRSQEVAPAPGNDLNAESRAQLGADPDERPYRPQPYDASVEDPLKDWPEDDR